MTLRSALIGTALIAMIAAIAPFNDYIVANTFLIGGFLPPVLVLALLGLSILVNAPLHRWRPDLALGTGELAVITAMLLVGCSIPTTGVMRLFIPLLVAPFYQGSIDPAFHAIMDSTGLPKWLFPVESITSGPSSMMVRAFYNRLPPNDAVPFHAWIGPLAAWGVFFAGLFLTIIALAMILRRQWSENEHLTFPLAQLQLSLIESPAPGRSFNALLSNRAFWIAGAAVFFIHGLNALNRYAPAIVPAFPLNYDLAGVLAEPPLVYLAGYVKSATLFFTFIGVSYFIPLRANFSIWFFLLLEDAISVGTQSAAGYAIPNQAWKDQSLGAAVIFVLGLCWVARRDWASTFRSAFVRGKAVRRPDELLSDRAILILILAGVSVMFGWLFFVGVHAWVAFGIVAFILMTQFVTARIVAELGLSTVKCDVDFLEITANLPPTALTTHDAYFTGTFSAIGPTSTRECLLPFATHAFEVARVSRVPPRRRFLFLGLIAWSLALAFTVSATSSLWCYYRYAVPLTPEAGTVINRTGLEIIPKAFVIDPMTEAAANRHAPRTSNFGSAITTGAAVVGVLQLASWRWAWWPLVPVGYLISPTWQIRQAWFSLLIGWIAKALLVRFGGYSLYRAARPVFIGLIVGEAAAAAFWLVVNLCLAALGMEYHPIGILPL